MYMLICDFEGGKGLEFLGIIYFRSYIVLETEWLSMKMMRMVKVYLRQSQRNSKEDHRIFSPNLYIWCHNFWMCNLWSKFVFDLFRKLYQLTISWVSDLLFGNFCRCQLSSILWARGYLIGYWFFYLYRTHRGCIILF